MKIPGEDPTSATYVTKNVGLEVPSTGLKVMFSANRASTADIRVAYALFRKDDAENEFRYQLFPGYDNLDESGQIINVRNNSGLPDTFVAPSMQKDTFREYEFTIDSLKEFDDVIGSSSLGMQPVLINRSVYNDLRYLDKYIQISDLRQLYEIIKSL